MVTEKQEILNTLREHAPELRAAGVVHLRLHGSIARGQASLTSDVDLIAELNPEKRLTLVDMARLENRLADLLGVRVDLSPEHMLKDPVRDSVAREAVLAF